VDAIKSATPITPKEKDMARQKRNPFRPQPREVVRARKRCKKGLQKLNPAIKARFDHGNCVIEGPEVLTHFPSTAFPLLPRPDAQERATHKQAKKPAESPQKKGHFHHHGFLTDAEFHRFPW